MSSADQTFQDAISALDGQKLGEAERLFKIVLTMQPNHVGALNLLTIVLMTLEQFSEAEETISRALKIDQSSDVSFYNCGIILKKTGKPQQALKQFDRALQLNPNVCETWNNRGTVFNDLEEYQRAISDFDRAISLNGNYSDAFCNKGKSLRELDRHDEALAAYDKALALNPRLAEAWLGRGDALFAIRRRGEAVGAYDRALALRPELTAAWLGRGNALLELKRHQEAATAYDQVLAAKPDLTGAWLGRGNALSALRRFDQGLAAYDKALARTPDMAEAELGRGNVFFELKRHDEAFTAYDKALALRPDLAEAWVGRGAVFGALGRHGEAFAAYDKALSLRPDLAEAWLGRGTVFAVLKRFDDAFSAYDKALELKSDLAGVWVARGKVLSVLARFDEARSAYRRALAIQPNLFAAISDLASLLVAEGDVAEALKLARRALTANDTFEAKALVVSCLNLPFVHDGLGDLRGLLLRALSEPWTRPSNLVGATIQVLALNPAIRDGVERAIEAWPKRLPVNELAGPSGLAAIARDELLRTLLESTPVCDAGLERFATGLRCHLLATARSANSAVPESMLNLYCALARQCFINSYVFDHSDTEIEQARALRDALVAALASQTSVPALLPVAVASYFPLYTLPGAERLLDRAWPEAVNAVLVQQIRGPIEERRLRASMPVLTTIDDAVSVLVRDQYEEHPYPQWVKTALVGEPRFVGEYIHQTFPLSPFVEPGRTGAVDILVAGCGTGQHSIETALQFKDAQVLAVDLSLASLSYAQRQTSALGLNTIRYAQADIMKLPSLGRTFDVIESMGVLHHLADPWAGWRALLSILRPGGLMRLGLYSEIARQMFSAARDLIAMQGYGRADDDIRRFRQQVLDSADGAPLKNALLALDFFSLSECRDLLFHAQEHRLTLPEIAAFIGENGLRFIGFEIELQAKRNYARQFPDDAAMTNLMQWHRYELDNPRTFLKMYQFWVQKM